MRLDGENLMDNISLLANPLADYEENARFAVGVSELLATFPDAITSRILDEKSFVSRLLADFCRLMGDKVRLETLKSQDFQPLMAPSARIERATLRLGGECSIP